MAKQDALFTSGRIGNVIFYRWKGIGCARIAPRKIKQTKATKQSAKDFGRAVRLSRFLRSYLSPALPNYKSREVMYKMNASLLHWLREEKAWEQNISFIGLEFNDKSPFSSRFRKELSIDFDKKGKVMITVPKLKIPDDIIAPSATSSVKLDIAAAGCILNPLQYSDAASVSISMPYEHGSIAPIKKELKFSCKPGSINILAVSLHYITIKDGREKQIIDERWTPAAIISAVVH